MDTFKEWVESTILVRRDGVGAKTDKQWLHYIVRTKDWIEELTDQLVYNTQKICLKLYRSI